MHRNHFQITADLKVFIEHSRKLGDRHAVPSREWKLPHKRSKFRFKDIPCDACTVYWIRTIANDDFLSEPPGSSHAIRQGVNKGVDAATNILHVKNEYVDVLQHRVGGFTRFTVK